MFTCPNLGSHGIVPCSSVTLEISPFMVSWSYSCRCHGDRDGGVQTCATYMVADETPKSFDCGGGTTVIVTDNDGKLVCKTGGCVQSKITSKESARDINIWKVPAVMQRKSRVSVENVFANDQWEMLNGKAARYGEQMSALTGNVSVGGILQS